MERYAEIIAALKIRTSNKKGRHLSTSRAIRLLEEDGVETPDSLVRAPAGLLKRATVDRVLRASGLDHARVVRPIAAVRFQAKRSNELWHFDMSRKRRGSSTSGFAGWCCVRRCYLGWRWRRLTRCF